VRVLQRKVLKLKIKTGIDLIEIQRLQNLSPSIRKRFMDRVYTKSELVLINESLISAAGRFAAKEAVAKALGCGIGVIRWQDIEILEGESGEPILHLHGKAQRISRRKGFKQWSISISHTAQYATAVAIVYGSDQA